MSAGPGPVGDPDGSAEAPVTSVGTRAYRVPTDVPEADGTLAWDATTVVVVQVSAGGHTGTGWTYGPAAAARAVEELLADVVVGRDALTPEAVQAAMVRAVRNAGRPGLVSMAISAVDVAVWDLCGRLLGQPLHRLWGHPGSPVPAYGSGGFTTYDDRQLTAQLDRWLTLGMRQVKIKIGESWGTRVSRDLARTALTRRVVGDDIEVFVDANGGYQPGLACRVGRSLDELGVTWFEEPVTSDDLAGLRRVREAVGADVTAGEYGYDLTYFRRMLDAGAVDCLQVDVTRCGGYTEWRRIAAVAAAHHLEVSGHCAPYLTAPVAAATPHLRHVEFFHDHERLAERLFEGCRPAIDGLLAVSDAPGHGLALADRAAEPWRVA